MITFKQTIILVFFLFIAIPSVYAQKKLNIGITTGAIRFYPEASFFHGTYNNSLENGFGWSAGIFFEYHWKTKIHPIVELNYYNLTSDLYLHETVFSFTEDPPTRKDVIKDLEGEAFNYLSLSFGFKYYFGEKLYVYPGFEVARSFDKPVSFDKLKGYFGDWMITQKAIDILKEEYTKRIISNAKLGIGLNLNKLDLILEYSYGLNKQLDFYDFEIPMGFAKRNNYLQLKAQIPILKK